MNDKDFLYGCRSGIQKGIRRGDLNLVKTCFDTLWANPQQRQWIKWRMTVLVLEEAWYLIGELAEFTKKKDDSEKAWRRFVYYLTLAPKQKDVFALVDAGQTGKREKLLDLFGSHPELEFISNLEEGVDILDALDTAVALTKKKGVDLSAYEKAAVQFLKSRASRGGGVWDRFMCVAAICCIVTRELEESAVKKTVAESVKAYASLGVGKPKTVSLPWYVFDMHTQVGKVAMSVFEKYKKEKFKVDHDLLEYLWFNLESSHVPKSFYRLAEPGDKVTAVDLLWWPTVSDIGITRDNLPPLAAKKLWVHRVRPEIENIVNWSLSKRDK